MFDFMEIYEDESLLKNTVVKGNVQLERYIDALTTYAIGHKLDLYKAQEFVKEKVIKRYNEELYNKSAEAINFIIEKSYADKLREEQPYANYRDENKTATWY